VRQGRRWVGPQSTHKLGAAPGRGSAAPNKKQRGGSPLLKSLSRGLLPGSGQQQTPTAEPSAAAPESQGSPRGASPGCTAAPAGDAGLRIEGQLVEGYLESERASAEPGSEGPVPHVPEEGGDAAASGCTRDQPGAEQGPPGAGKHPGGASWRGAH